MLGFSDWVLIIAGGVLAAGILLRAFETRAMFPAPRPTRAKLDLPEEARFHIVETRRGNVECVLLPPLNETTEPFPVMIFCHGNGGLIDFFLKSFNVYRQEGYGIFLVEFPGYGRSTGPRSTKGIEMTLREAYNWLLSQPDVDPQAIIGSGRSMGGGAICSLAAQVPLAGVILQSTYSSLKVVAREHCGWLAKLMRNHFDNLSVVEKLEIPVLIFHGTEDRIVRHSHAERLHRVAQNSRLLSLKCGHNNCGDISLPVLEFLRTVAPVPLTART